MSWITLTVLVCFSTTCYCSGLPKGRVVGGDYASDRQFRHQVSLRDFGSHNCGGSIISKTCILTAAHCVTYYNWEGNLTVYKPSWLTVRLGSTDRFQGGILARVANIIVHENYGNFLNDVSIVRLEKPIIFSENVQPIKLASFELPLGAKVLISGWGRVKQNGDIPRKLKYNELTVISREQCSAEIGWDENSLICLAHKAGNGACNGDSGGPAIYNNELIGVAGFVHNGCGTKYPDGYAKVSFHLDWIKKNSDI